MDKHDLTPKHVLPVFVILALFVLMASRGEVAPMDRLYAPTPALLPNPPCDCESEELDCADFRTREDTQFCLDYCWIQTALLAGRNLRHQGRAGFDAIRSLAGSRSGAAAAAARRPGGPFHLASL